MADITVSYKGNTIAEVSASGTTTLGTSGKYCEDDISVAYVQPVSTSWTKLGEQEFTVNTSNTSQVNVGTMTVPGIYTKDQYIVVTVRDKVGKRNGYFLGTDSVYANANAANGSTSYFSVAMRLVYSCDSSGNYIDTSGAYGVYATAMTSAGELTIASRYHSTYSLTINGTYVVTVWGLSFAPNTNPFA